MIQWPDIITIAISISAIITTILIYNIKEKKNNLNSIELHLNKTVHEIKKENKEFQTNINGIITRIFDKIEKNQIVFNELIDIRCEKIDKKFETITNEHGIRINGLHAELQVIKIHHRMNHPNEPIDRK